MVANSTTRHIHLVRIAQVAGEAFGYQALHENGPAEAGYAGWAKPALALLLVGFLATAAYLAF